MEKRTILAFALSLIVLLAWNYFYTPSAPVPTPPPAAQSLPAPAPGADTIPPLLTDETGRVEQIAPVAPATEMRDITVENDFFLAVFTEEGARLKSYQLKKYRESWDEAAPQKELVNIDDIGNLPLATSLVRRPGLNLERAPFQADQAELDLTGGSRPAKLRFMHTTADGLVLIKEYSFQPDSYLVGLTVRLLNQSPQTIEDNLGLRSANRPLMSGRHYSFSGLGMLLDDELSEIKIAKLEKKLPPLLEKSYVLGWAGYEDQYFLTAVRPQGLENTKLTAEAYMSDGVSYTLISPPFSLAPGQAATIEYELFYGPKDYRLLKEYNQGLDRFIYFGWFDIIAKPMLVAMLWIHRFVPNYGLTIILLTILIKILFWPLTQKSYKSMKEMQKLQPLITKLREKYKNDREAMNREMMQLYRTYKVNPMGGCLPLLIQLPVFIALYRLLDYSLELRHAPFWLWIHDLSAPDRLFHFDFKIPFMQEPTGIPVLTLLMGLTMFIQQKMTPTVQDPAQARIFMLMPIFFTFIFINFPSGLVLYWLINNILSIGQQYYINKRMS